MLTVVPAGSRNGPARRRGRCWPRTTQIASAPSRSPTNAIELPSGDGVGWRSEVGLRLRLRRFPVRVSRIQISSWRSGVRVLAKSSVPRGGATVVAAPDAAVSTAATNAAMRKRRTRPR